MNLNSLFESDFSNKKQLNEVDPRNFDSDEDYYAALNASAKRRNAPSDYPYSQEQDDDYFREIFRKKREAAAKEQGVAEDVRLPYPVRSEKLGRANMELLIRAYNQPTSPRTTLSFGDRILELDREDIDAIAQYYDNVLKDDTARWNFISGVMSDPDGLTNTLVKLGRRKSQTASQPGLFQEADKKKDDALEPQVKDVALQRAISRAKADFPAAGSGIEALAKDFMRSQDQDQKSFDQIRQAERQQNQMLDKINQLDQEQAQEIQGLETQNSGLAKRLQQLQSVNNQLEKKLAAMSGRKLDKKSDTVAAAPSSPVAVYAPQDTKDASKSEPRSTKKKKSKKASGSPKAPRPLALPEPTAPSSMSSMTKQLTTQNPDVLEPTADYVRGSAPRFNTTGAQDVVPRNIANNVKQNINTMGDAMVGDKLQQVAKDELGNQQDWTQPANDELPMFRKKQAAENKEQKSEPPEVDYDDPKWDAMVKRVGQKAKEGPRKTVYDPVKRVYKTVPVNPVKEQEPGNRAGYNAIKSVSDWAEKLRTMRELQKDVALMADPEAKDAVQQRIGELLKFGIQQGYVK
jgi:hypothetical protein